ncbi:MAG: 4-hydroxy-tetrahydrodipicolinate reductase [Chitinophagaceae bacterium]|nr:4-hydroxy-tetrahydrodipicolinate reductase [Chitinophagaceae bacterium]
MNIAIIGYGKMGKTIEQIATQRGHNIILKISSSNLDELTAENLKKADVAIEMTQPEAAKENILLCLNTGVPVTSGTTGWNAEIPVAEQAAKDNNTSFLYASNYSVGVNIFFEVNKLLAKLMNEQPNYEVSMTEIHHLQKKDSPSGTAITLANQITNAIERKNKWSEEEKSDDTLFITALREEGVFGTHSIKYHSEIDDIDITHTANNRKGFALGAVLAAEYIADKKGVFTMQDVLGINK